MSGHRRIALLLSASGMCALIYQVAWLRELRLVFGASTPASAAVLAVFMGGLGLGSLRLSRRAERAEKPLLLYAHLELAIAVCAALTPLLLAAVRAGYVALGGTTALGVVGGTVLRLIAAAIVLGPATFLMGGTLPAAARAAESEEDTGRHRTALLYGANTMGAVVGAAVSTFVMLEVFGTQLTLWLGCAVNALVAMIARAMDRGLPALKPARVERVVDDAQALAPPRFVLAAAGVVGFVFLLLELVWYRMLAPLLGGSTYTFGLILAVALLGVGLGGLVYTLRPRASPTLLGFSLSCALEALMIAAPFALGDSIAVAAMMLRSFGTVGLFGHALAWFAITALVVLPAAMVAGYQFPMLIALLGRGRRAVGRHVGLAYAFNTLGAICGSLAGGFVLMQWIGAPDCWRLCVVALSLLAALAMGIHVERARVRVVALLWPTAVVLAALMAVALPAGPTAAWRHSPIGAGRAEAALQGATRNSLRNWLREQRYGLVWEADGRESSVALIAWHDVTFHINGKSDGSAFSDATTQVMGAVIGALLRPHVERALVIGLGTGATAGWLARVPHVARVDAVEIEPAIVEVARRFAPVNERALDNPKLTLHDGDAREVLLTTREQYDLIFSEPSNPYRAGIASLFTREFYQAAEARLRPRGIFIQWLQGYEIDVASVATVYATLSSVFGSVTTWQSDVNDLLLIASDGEEPLDVAVLRERIAMEPFDRALMAGWRVDSVEGLFAHYVGNPALAQAIAGGVPEAAINTDDRNLLEFAVARSLGRPSGFTVDALRRTAERRGMGAPEMVGELDWDAVRMRRMYMTMVHTGVPANADPRTLDGSARPLYDALHAWSEQRYHDVLAHWARLEAPVHTPVSRMVVADALAMTENADDLFALLERHRVHMPTEALAIEARLAHAQGDGDVALAKLALAFESHRRDPWASPALMARALRMAPELATRDAKYVEPALAVLERPFVLDALHSVRERYRVIVAMEHPSSEKCAAAFAALEPNVPWEARMLARRVECYAKSDHPLLALARDELATFVADDVRPVDGGLVP